MRIGYLTYGLDRAPTGIGRYAVELLEALLRASNGHEVVVLATEDEDVQGLSKICEYHRVTGCRTLPALMTFGNFYLPELTRRYGLDAFHDPNGIAPFLGHRGSTRCIVTLHDAFAYVHRESHNWLDNWRYRWYLPYVARRAEAVITVSECSRNDLINYLALDPDKVAVIPEGVHQRFTPINDVSEQRTILDRYGVKPPYLLYVGALNARKNVPRLLEAFDRVRARHPEVQLVIAGKRQWKAKGIDQAITRLELDAAVRFTGYVDDKDLPVLYASAVAFLFPSLYEGFGLPPLEAMACGTPVITSNVSSLPEVTGDAAILIDPEDVTSLTRAMERVLTDDQLRSDLSMRGSQRASLFTWENAAQRTLKLYDRVVQQEGRMDTENEKTSLRERARAN